MRASRMAFIGMVASAAFRATAGRSPRCPSAPELHVTGESTSIIVFCPTFGFATRLDGFDRRSKARASLARDRIVAGRFLAERHEQRSIERADAPPTFMTSVMPTAFSASGSGFAARSSQSASTASKPRFMLRP